jgi:hypothetical protein
LYPDAIRSAPAAGDPVLDDLAVAGDEGCTLLGEGLAEGVQLRRDRFGAVLRNGVAAQETHAAAEADALRLLLQAVEHLDRLARGWGAPSTMSLRPASSAASMTSISLRTRM